MRKAILAGLVASVVGGFGAASSYGQNLLANPSFELPALNGGDAPGAQGYNVFGGAFTLDIGYSNTGDQSLKIFGNPGGAFQSFAASPGQTYIGSVTAINPAADALATDAEGQVQVNFLDAGGNLLVRNGVTTVTAATPQTNDIPPFTPFTTGPVIAPAGTASVQFFLLVGAFTDRNNDGQVTYNGGAVFFDDASLTLGGVVPEPTTLTALGAASLLLGRRRRG